MLGMVLVLFGTLAQVYSGTEEVQRRFFQSLLIWLNVGEHRVPILPGGYLLGGIVGAHLLAVIAVWFRPTLQNIGLYSLHGGLVILLIGMFLTELSVKSQVMLRDGESVNYSEDLSLREAVITDGTREMIVPEEKLEREGVILPQGLEKQWLEIEGKWWRLEVRPMRYEKPYLLTLQSFTRECYVGTDIPSRITSRITFKKTTGKTVPYEAVISMNQPLRYEGEIFYQVGFGPDGKTTILHVVKNPAAAVPYIACIMIVVGLALHFVVSRTPNMIAK